MILFDDILFIWPSGIVILQLLSLYSCWISEELCYPIKNKILFPLKELGTQITKPKNRLVFDRTNICVGRMVIDCANTKQPKKRPPPRRKNQRFRDNSFFWTKGVKWFGGFFKSKYIYMCVCCCCGRVWVFVCFVYLFRHERKNQLAFRFLTDRSTFVHMEATQGGFGCVFAVFQL